MIDFILARENMINGQIHTSGIVKKDILSSFAEIPRELFVPEKLRDIAYVDKHIFLGQGRYMIKPVMHAKLVQAIEPDKEDVVLDIGVGSGYSSAILSPLVSTIIAIENNKRQMDKATRMWNKLELCNIALMDGNLLDGYAEQAPYNLIIINGSVDEVPEALLEQLLPLGRLVCFVRQKDSVLSNATLFIKSANGYVSSKNLFEAEIPYVEETTERILFNF